MCNWITRYLQKNTSFVNGGIFRAIAWPCILKPQKLDLVKGIYVKWCAPFDSVMLAGGGVINFEVLLKGKARFLYFLYFSNRISVFLVFDSVMLAGGVINLEFLQGQGPRQDNKFSSCLPQNDRKGWEDNLFIINWPFAKIYLFHPRIFGRSAYDICLSSSS